MLEGRYHVRFNPNVYEHTAYSLWDTISGELIAFELTLEEARKLFNDFIQDDW